MDKDGDGHYDVLSQHKNPSVDPDVDASLHDGARKTN